MTTYALVRVPGAGRPDRARMGGALDLDAFARAAGMHPDLVRRLVVLGLLDAAGDPAGELSFSPAQLGRAARIQRLRAGFALNYAALGLVLDLLDRVAELERLARRQPVRQAGSRSWTRTV